MAGRPDLVAALGRPAQRVLGLLAPLGATRDGGTASGREVVAAVGHLLAAAAQEHGVVLVLEDLHEADEATVGALHYLVAAARGERTLIVGSARPDEGGEAVAALRRRLVEQRAMAEVVLRPLPPEPLRRLIARSAAHPLPADTVDAIVAMSAGNPLFAEELAAVAGPSAAPSLPDRLRTVLDARLERLEAVVARRVLDALAVLDDGCTTEEVAEVAAADPAEVEPGLEAGVRTGALTRAAGGWGFRHPLLRDAARRRVAPARLAEAHRAVAACLERRGAAPERVAAHLLDGDRAREAVPWLRAAAARAAEVGALADGARWVELALRHADPAALAELLELLGDLRHGMGDQRAPGAYGRARAVAPADALARLAVKQARAHLALGDLAAARAAIAAAGDPQGHERDALLVRGMIAWYGGDFAAARGLAAEAARHPPRGDGHDTAVSLEAMSAHAEGRWERAMEARLAEAWHVPRLVGRVVDAYLCVTEYVLHAGDPADVLTRFARELHEQAAAAGAERGRAFAATVLGEAQLLAGEPEAALGHLAEAVRLSRRVGAVGGESLARLRLAEALMALGRPLEGRAQLEEALDLAHASPLADHLLFLVHAPLVRWAASPGEAMAVLDRSEALLGAQASCRFCPVEYHVAAAIACARAGETDRGHRFLLRAEDAVALWTGGPRWASLAEARGELLRAEEREEEAQIAFLRAVDGYAAAGHRAHEQRVRGLLGAPA
jgi:tetratricopeptide (TPR) repeat protein